MKKSQVGKKYSYFWYLRIRDKLGTYKLSLQKIKEHKLACLKGNQAGRWIGYWCRYKLALKLSLLLLDHTGRVLGGMAAEGIEEID